eukprot:TRINITY_DN29275_c0_g1_i1.p1 TRINITY_DN29275_c0_g1~~TRINITY_DN29275_c0_g1_i1.p1  ORF type:complete len:314 (-),score=99.24 TRINITY_DN29275_c0_g1_i1:204-1145(-)
MEGAVPAEAITDYPTANGNGFEHSNGYPQPQFESAELAMANGAMPEGGWSAEQIQDFIDVLEKHRLESESNGKYDQAQLAKIRIEQLRSHEEERRREELRSQHLADRLNVEEAHMKQLQEFNQFWDSKAAQFEEHAATLQSTLAARHKADLDSYMKKLQATTEPRKPKCSKELLNLRKIQDSFARQKNYSEAQYTQNQADVIQKRDEDAWRSTRDAKIAHLERQFVHKQDLEMGGLQKRIQSGREEQKQARKSELEILLQRYHNVKGGLESHQKIASQRMERHLNPRSPGRPGSAKTSPMPVGGKPKMAQTAR